MRTSPLAMALFAALALSSARAETLAASPPAETAAAAARLTEGEARSRIEATGYTQVSALRLDERGLWHGRALRNGDPCEVSLDDQGNLEDSRELAALTLFGAEELRTASQAPIPGAAMLVMQVSR